ncbi:hypothetical protein E3N88_10772 [Mikania micrantha]|uniref:Ubiquitin-like domain-containing protein n=1 Tax=Mikania micrantha TaxID=192012 RepID=A0A5N6PBG9_9ASTR|nr:hypothetical protein E3N88_10772 [Mikania micrantha]
MASEESIEVKFRLADGSDIGPKRYSPTITVGSLKEMILSQLPQDESNGPKTINDMKLINAGKILENHKTLAESRSLVSEVPGGIITMLVVMRPPMPDNNHGYGQMFVIPNANSPLVKATYLALAVLTWYR